MNQDTPFVITISRQLGSGGAYIGQQVAKRLGIFYADREIISEAAKKLSVREDELETRDERALLWRSFIESYASASDNYLPTQIVVPIDRELFEAEAGIIERIASERSAVIIGRCGHFVLREHPKHISVFLFADEVFRCRRIMQLYDLSEEEALKIIRKSDKERGRYNRIYTGKKWSDSTQYNLLMNTGKIGLDQAVEVILKYAENIGTFMEGNLSGQEDFENKSDF